VDQLAGQLQVNDERKAIREFPDGELPAAPDLLNDLAPKVIKAEPRRRVEQLGL
jgi:hypothetical protein